MSIPKIQTSSLFSETGFIQNYDFMGYQIRRDNFMQAYEVIQKISDHGATQVVWRWFPKKEDAETFIRAQQRVARSQ